MSQYCSSVSGSRVFGQTSLQSGCLKSRVAQHIQDSTILPGQESAEEEVNKIQQSERKSLYLQHSEI